MQKSHLKKNLLKVWTVVHWEFGKSCLILRHCYNLWYLERKPKSTAVGFHASLLRDCTYPSFLYFCKLVKKITFCRQIKYKSMEKVDKLQVHRKKFTKNQIETWKKENLWTRRKMVEARQEPADPPWCEVRFSMSNVYGRQVLSSLHQPSLLTFPLFSSSIGFCLIEGQLTDGLVPSSLLRMA